jgi:hypothetical protein
MYVCMYVFLSGVGMSTLADKGLHLSSKWQHCLVHIVVSVLVSHMNGAVFTAPLQLLMMHGACSITKLPQVKTAKSFVGVKFNVDSTCA